MPEVLIDITRLLTRSLQGRLPTGVDRVSLAYIKYFFDRAQALLRIDQQSVVLNQSASKRIFEQLLFPATHLHTKIIKLFKKHAVEKNVCNYVVSYLTKFLKLVAQLP